LGIVYRRNSQKTFVEKSEGKTIPGRPKHRWEDNIIMNVKEIWCDKVERICLAHRAAGSCEHSNKPLGPRHSASGWSLTSQRGGPGSSLGLDMWNLWCTKWCWGKVSPSTSVSPANLHSTSFSTITIYHLGLAQ
jgi:hypothetical protein